MSFSINDIQFGRNEENNYINPNIFSNVAESAAEKIGKSTSSTQIRRFYEELSMWNEKVQVKPLKFREPEFKKLEPFIKMMKAKAAYARGRDHIDDEFHKIFNRTVEEIKSAETLNDAKLFMEAVIGYCRYLGK